MSAIRASVIAASVMLSGVAFAQPASKPTDPQIAHIAYTAGVIDIKAAELARKQSTNKEVRAFADDMIRDHKAVNDQALALVKKLKVTPEDNATSRALNQQAEAKLKELRLSRERLSTTHIRRTRSVGGLPSQGQRRLRFEPTGSGRWMRRPGRASNGELKAPGSSRAISASAAEISQGSSTSVY